MWIPLVPERAGGSSAILFLPSLTVRNLARQSGRAWLDSARQTVKNIDVQFTSNWSVAIA
jgi:hypothetical protein